MTFEELEQLVDLLLDNESDSRRFYRLRDKYFAYKMSKV